MTRKLSLVALVVSFTLAGIITPVQAQVRSTTIEWQKDPQVAWQMAVQQEKPLLVFVSAEWCGYCQKMKRETWTDADVVQQVRERFVPLFLDADKYNDLVTDLRVEAYPTTMIITPNGKITQELTGYARATQVLPFLKKDAAPKPKATVASLRETTKPVPSLAELRWRRSQ